MLHPIFSLLISKPDLVIDHVSGYATLAREEAGAVGIEVVKRAIAWGVCLMSFIMFLLLAGVAAMLGFLFEHFHWILLVVPGVVLAVAVVAFMQAREKMSGRAFAELRSQLDADAETLRGLGAQS